MRMSSSDKRSAAQKTARRGILLCLALCFSYLEIQLPLPVPIPGCKPGFANIVITFSALSLGFPDALCISLLRVIVSSLLFGNLSGFWFSVSGALCAFLVLRLTLPQKDKKFSILGISVACAAAHNVGQLIAAAVLLRSAAVFSYYPVLMFSAAVTGSVSGMLLYVLLPALRHTGIYKTKEV